MCNGRQKQALFWWHLRMKSSHSSTTNLPTDMSRFILSGLFVAAALGSHLAVAQQTTKSQAADPATTSTKPDNPATPASSWTTPTSGGAASNDDAPSRIEGAHIAPGFTAAPSMRVRYDYRGRPMGAPVHRPVVRSSEPALSPAPVTQSNASGAAATNQSAGAEGTSMPATPTSPATPAASNSLKSPAATAPKTAPVKKPAPAPKKKQSDGWGSSPSGW